MRRAPGEIAALIAQAPGRGRASQKRPKPSSRRPSDAGANRTHEQTTGLAPPDHEAAPETAPVDPTVAKLAELYRQHASGDQGRPTWRIVGAATASDDPDQPIAVQLVLGKQILDKGRYTPRQIASVFSLATTGGLEKTGTFLLGVMEGIADQREKSRERAR